MCLAQPAYRSSPGLRHPGLLVVRQSFPSHPSRDFCGICPAAAAQMLEPLNLWTRQFVSCAHIAVCPRGRLASFQGFKAYALPGCGFRLADRPVAAIPTLTHRETFGSSSLSLAARVAFWGGSFPPHSASTPPQLLSSCPAAADSGLCLP